MTFYSGRVPGTGTSSGENGTCCFQGRVFLPLNDIQRLKQPPFRTHLDAFGCLSGPDPGVEVADRKERVVFRRGPGLDFLTRVVEFSLDRNIFGLKAEQYRSNGQMRKRIGVKPVLSVFSGGL